MSMRLALEELAVARQSLDKLTGLILQLPEPVTSPATKANPSACQSQNSSIKIITENGFSIERLCERERFTGDCAGVCHFIVRAPDGEERRVKVVFAEATMMQLQTAACLPTALRFWLCCAERYLSVHLWDNDCFPPAECLIVETLTPQDLLLARRL